MPPEYCYMLRKGLLILLINALLMLMLNNSLFRHFHRLPDGTIIEHAHPFTSTPEQQESAQGHHHSQQEIIFLDTIFHLFEISILVIFIILAIFRFENKIRYVFNRLHGYLFSGTIRLLRGPPCL